MKHLTTLQSPDLGKVSCLWTDLAEGFRYTSSAVKNIESNGAAFVCVPDKA
jgi:hypothetical protein